MKEKNVTCKKQQMVYSEKDRVYSILFLDGLCNKLRPNRRPWEDFQGVQKQEWRIVWSHVVGFQEKERRKKFRTYWVGQKFRMFFSIK